MCSFSIKVYKLTSRLISVNMTKQLILPEKISDIICLILKF